MLSATRLVPVLVVRLCRGCEQILIKTQEVGEGRQRGRAGGETVWNRRLLSFCVDLAVLDRQQPPRSTDPARHAPRPWSASPGRQERRHARRRGPPRPPGAGTSTCGSPSWRSTGACRSTGQATRTDRPSGRPSGTRSPHPDPLRGPAVRPLSNHPVDLPWNQVAGSYRSGAVTRRAAADQAGCRSVDARVARMPVASLQASEPRRRTFGRPPGR
jgi:hypothetical protein